MERKHFPAPLYKLALLQAYLYEIFDAGKHCEHNLKYTEWYLNHNFSENEIVSIMNFLNESGMECDCDIINKVDLRDFSNVRTKFHE